MSDFSYCWSGVHASFEPGHGETLAAGTSFGSQVANDRQTVREPAPGSLDATNRAAPLVDTQSDGSRAACTPSLERRANRATRRRGNTDLPLGAPSTKISVVDDRRAAGL